MIITEEQQRQLLLAVKSYESVKRGKQMTIKMKLKKLNPLNRKGNCVLFIVIMVVALLVVLL